MHSPASKPAKRCRLSEGYGHCNILAANWVDPSDPLRTSHRTTTNARVHVEWRVNRHWRGRMQQVADWLEKLGLGQYAKRFAENEITVPILADLTDADLKELGVSALGHRRLLLRAISRVRVRRRRHTEACGCACGTCHTTSA